MPMDTPVCLIIFRRPEHTRRLLDVLSVVKPRNLFVVADGPRPGFSGEDAACAATRSLIDQVDWPCDIRRSFSDSNLGCGFRPASGIDWVFGQVDRAIILEDDCLPDPSFFTFCEETLERYFDDPSVMHINGTNFSSEPLPITSSYSFSKVVSCWGWATWRRAWRYHDLAVRDWPYLEGSNVLRDAISHPRMASEFSAMLADAHRRAGDVSYWDYQWALACWSRGGHALIPRQNLISNCGCGLDATHTFDSNSRLANIVTGCISFPLIHPVQRIANPRLDTIVQRKIIGSSTRPGILGKVHRVGRRGAAHLARQFAGIMESKLF